MNRRAVRTQFVTMAVAACLLCCPAATAKKPPTPTPEEPPPTYTVVDLRGIPDDCLQSCAQSISQPDTAGAVFVAGCSRAADRSRR